MFLAYRGQMRWRTRAGDEVGRACSASRLTKDVTAQAWRTALDPTGEWMPAGAAAADKRLTEVRRSVPDAGGLVIASDQTKARAYAKQLQAITGEKPTVVLSDDAGRLGPDRGVRARATSAGWSPSGWSSEGVDVPRLAVGVYATSTSTPLFFAQAVGRFVRARRRGETASVFLPSVPLLLGLAGELEVERDHVLRAPRRRRGPPRGRPGGGPTATTAPPTSCGNQLRGARGAGTFDRVLFDGEEFGTEAQVGTDEELDFLGIPGLLEPDQVRDLLRHRQRSRRTAAGAEPEPTREPTTHEQLAVLRRELNGLIGAWHHRTGQAHGVTHAALRKELGGPAAAIANADQLLARINRLREWAAKPSA